MERDIDLTIGDIHADLKDDDSLIGEFSNYVVSQETHTNLRFLKIPQMKHYSEMSMGVTCELTEKGDYPGTKSYVVVSYCWESFTNFGSNVDGRSQHPPAIKVEERGKPPRAPRCPAKILMRAIAFAIYMGSSLIWIDQECVNQEDPDDIQNHLQCNHIIFSQAEFKLGLLNFQLSASQANILLSLELYQLQSDPDFRRRVLVGYGRKSILRDIQYLNRLLRAIRRDRFFSRAWIYQERHSANMDMHLLIPLSNKGLESLSGALGKEPVGGDYPLDVTSICSIAVTLKLLLSETELGQVPQEDIPDKKSVDESLNLLHEAAQLLSGPIFSGTSFDRVFESFKSLRAGTDRGREIENIRNLHLHQVFLELESCDSRVISDRVAILSNLMNFEQRVITTSFKSYSWALLMLLSANNYMPSVLVQEETQTKPGILCYSVPASGLIMLAYEMKDMIAARRLKLQKKSENASRRSKLQKKLENVSRRLRLQKNLENVSRGLELQKELDNVSRALKDVFGRDIIRHTKFWDAVEDAAKDLPGASHTEPLSLLSKIKMQNLKRVVVVPLSATIGDIIGGIVPAHHEDNVGLKSSHGDNVIRYGINTNQLKKGVMFMAFVGEYRWRSEFIESFTIV